MCGNNTTTCRDNYSTFFACLCEPKTYRVVISCLQLPGSHMWSLTMPSPSKTSWCWHCSGILHSFIEHCAFSELDELFMPTNLRCLDDWNGIEATLLEHMPSGTIPVIQNSMSWSYCEQKIGNLQGKTMNWSVPFLEVHLQKWLSWSRHNRYLLFCGTTSVSQPLHTGSTFHLDSCVCQLALSFVYKWTHGKYRKNFSCSKYLRWKFSMQNNIHICFVSKLW